MIRQPSTQMRLLQWHRAALRGDNPPRHEGDPQCGWYKMRKVRNGPFVAVEIYCVSDIDENGELTDDEYFMAKENGIDTDPVIIWTHLRPITRAEFNDLLERPLRDSRFSDPTKPINLGQEPTEPF